MSSNEVRYRLHTIVALADLLECVENGTAQASADGYRLLVQRLQVGLSQDLPPDVLLRLLNQYPVRRWTDRCPQSSWLGRSWRGYRALRVRPEMSSA
jgi:hypothetical protein